MNYNITLIKQFEEDLKTGECQNIEFKEQLSNLDKSKLAKEIAAFSTSNDGRIYIGVSKKCEIKGIPEINDINNTVQKDKFQRNLRDISKSVKPRVITKIHFLHYDNKVVILMEIEKGAERVYYYNKIPYIRDNDESRPAEPEEVDKLYGLDESNYKELNKKYINNLVIHIFGYLKYPDPYELFQIIEKYEREFSNCKLLFVHLFNKSSFNLIEYPFSDEQLKYKIASYYHNKNNNSKKILVYSKDNFKYSKNEIKEIFGNWDDYSQNKDEDKLIYFLDTTPNPTKAIFVMKENRFKQGILELIEGAIIYEDFQYFSEVTKSLLVLRI